MSGGVSSWLIAVLAAVIILTAAEMLLPDGGMKKLVRGMFAIIIMVVIISPLPKLLDSDFQFQPDGGFTLDQEYLQSIYKQKVALLERSCEKQLKEEGFDAEIILTVSEYTDQMKILAVAVRMKDGKPAPLARVATILKVDFSAVTELRN